MTKDLTTKEIYKACHSACSIMVAYVHEYHNGGKKSKYDLAEIDRLIKLFDTMYYDNFTRKPKYKAPEIPHSLEKAFSPIWVALNNIKHSSNKKDTEKPAIEFALCYLLGLTKTWRIEKQKN